jgi:hypothetical protein
MATMRVFESGGCKTLTRTCIDETSKGNVDSPTPSVIFLFVLLLLLLFIYLFIYFLLFFYLFLFIYLFIYLFFLS